MNIRQPAALDLRAIFETALNERDNHRELWEMVLRDAFTEDGWHVEPGPGGRWSWHCSGIADCPRKLALQRLGERNDGIRLESRLTFEIGKLYHASLQFGMMLLPQYDVRGVEWGGHHRKLPLAGRCDVAYVHEDRPLLVELKTESPYAKQRRHREAKAVGIEGTFIRPEHWQQLVATSIVLRDVHDFETDGGWAVYVDKSSGDMEQTWAPFDENARQVALSRLAMIDHIGTVAMESGALPPQLPYELKPASRKKDAPMVPAPNWLCEPRSDADPRGKWCQVRSRCFELAREGR